MNIAIIGAGNIGSALAQGWSKKGHRIFLGVKDPAATETGSPLRQDSTLTWHTIAQAAQTTELIVISVPAEAVVEVANDLGALTDKIIIETTNGSIGTPDYPHAVAALKAITGCVAVIKCFNTTGFENLADPKYPGEGIDMFMAGTSVEAKGLCRRLARELGFAECYDLGDEAKINLLEQLARVWVTLAKDTKLGRNVALKVIKR